MDEALAADRRNRHAREELAELRLRHSSLTPRERDVLPLLTCGLLNKQLASALGVSEIMARVHKRRVLEKMRTRTVSDLVRAAGRLQIV